VRVERTAFAEKSAVLDIDALFRNRRPDTRQNRYRRKKKCA